MGSVFEPSERKIFAAGRYAATSCGRIGTNGASGSATVEKGPFLGGFGQAERAAEPPRGTGIGGGNPSEPPCEPHPSGGGAACGVPLAFARFQPSGARNRFWRLVTSPRQRLRAEQTARKSSRNILATPSARLYCYRVRITYSKGAAMKMEITSMSTKGQVVIPTGIRKTLGLVSGSKFSILTDGKRLLMRPLRPAEVKEFRRLIQADEAAAKKAKKGARK